MAPNRNDEPRKRHTTLAVIGSGITLVATTGYLLLCAWVYRGCPPISPAFWHRMMTFFQSVALLIGSWGISAEAAYNRALDETRLS